MSWNPWRKMTSATSMASHKMGKHMQPGEQKTTEARYAVLEFKNLSIPVVLVQDRSASPEVHRLYPTAAVWSVEAFVRFLAQAGEGGGGLTAEGFRMVNLAKAKFAGRVVRVAGDPT